MRKRWTHGRMAVRLAAGVMSVGLAHAVPPQPASPRVIADLGGTPVSVWLNADAVQWESPPRPAPQMSLQYPVRSAALSPGPLIPMTLNDDQQRMLSALARPLFIVGADEYSWQWLHQHRARLVEMQAIGLLVEVPDAHTAKVMRDAARPLPMAVTTGDGLAQSLGLTRYPAILQPGEVSQ